MPGTVKLALVDEATGKPIVEYGGIPRQVAMRVVAWVQPFVVAAANVARAQRSLDDLSRAASSGQNRSRRR